MSNPATRITEVVLDDLEGKTLAKRVTILRDLAKLARTPKEAARLNRLADGLAACEQEQREFTFDFKRGAL
ncbi:MAG: hypothetical protein KGL39_56130 [Patescibacteria group bacterium]|nr:hypothetical protein [Patescibacteria group bacterium]